MSKGFHILQQKYAQYRCSVQTPGQVLSVEYSMFRMFLQCLTKTSTRMFTTYCLDPFEQMFKPFKRMPATLQLCQKFKFECLGKCETLQICDFAKENMDFCSCWYVQVCKASFLLCGTKLNIFLFKNNQFSKSYKTSFYAMKLKRHSSVFPGLQYHRDRCPQSKYATFCETLQSRCAGTLVPRCNFAEQDWSLQSKCATLQDTEMCNSARAK